ncbi:hypothetical protein HanIR_Chr14g0698081 [Helianthus annuus]|nr:hypothetical protein HanIR_Chr14g0698081 [Helianthus annuus]
MKEVNPENGTNGNEEDRFALICLSTAPKYTSVQNYVAQNVL